jgi:hypothetical protein
MTSRLITTAALSLIFASSAQADVAATVADRPALTAVSTFPSLASSAGDTTATGSILIRGGDLGVSYSVTTCPTGALQCNTRDQVAPAAALTVGPGLGELTFVVDDEILGRIEILFSPDGSTPLRDACADRASRAAYALVTTGDVSFGLVSGALGSWHIQASGCSDWAADAFIQYQHG